MKMLLELLKLRITIASTTSTAVGYLMARGQVDWLLLPVLAGIFVQACGAAALNHVQESTLDARMPRTAKRPIPSGRISRRNAALFAIALLASGTLLLVLIKPLAAGLGLLAAVVYNGIYTPLKRVTPFAVVPGSLIGAIPPLAGWVAAGAYLFDPAIHQVAFFFFLWQIPHFWLLLLFYEQDYLSGGLPSLFDRFSRKQIARLTFVWIAAVAVAALAMPVSRTLRHQTPGLLIAVAGILLTLRAVHLLRDSGAFTSYLPTAENAGAYLRSCRTRFMEINLFALFVMVTLVADRLV